jgi:hypothetical protein
MGTAIIVPAYRQGAADQEHWDDLRVCLSAVAAYAKGFEVVVAWDGPCEPLDLPRNERCRVLRRPAGLKSPQAHYWAVQQTGADDFIGLSDDVVLQPDTVDRLLEDVAFIRSHGYKPGIVGCRSNFAPGAQNVRAANGGTWEGAVDGYTSEATILRADRISPFCAYVSREATEVVGSPEVEWFSDDLACFDLAREGYTNWISRAYVHHVGMRSSADGLEACERLNREAMAWLAEHRPDFLAYRRTGRLPDPATLAG